MTSASAPSAVTISTGVVPTLRIHSVTCQPSMPGRLRSRRTSAGTSSSNRRMTSVPSEAVAVRQPWRVTHSSTSSRNSGSSSTMRISSPVPGSTGSTGRVDAERATAG